MARISLTARDQREIAQIQQLLADHHVRTRADCIAIGEFLARHFERKRQAGEFVHGRRGAYVRQHFHTDADYLQRFVRLYIHQEIIPDAERLQTERGWINDYMGEPQRTCALLSWFQRISRDSAKSGRSLRNAITPPHDEASEAWQVLTGDCRTVLHGIAAQSIQAVITSPPYHALRDYDHPDQIGQEDSIANYIATLVQDVFRPIKTLLRQDGVVWVNLGDRMAGTEGWNTKRPSQRVPDPKPWGGWMMIPPRFAIAMQNDGWLCRSQVVWQKGGFAAHAGRQPQPIHEWIYLFALGVNYQYHADAVREPSIYPRTLGQRGRVNGRLPRHKADKGLSSIWRVPPVRGQREGIAPFPAALAERMLLLSTQPGDRVLDPFGGGEATVGVVAKQHGRHATLIEVHPRMADHARDMLTQCSI